MAIVSVTKIQGRDGSTNDKGVREFGEKYRVVSNDLSDGAGTIGGADGLPSVFDSYADDSASVVVGIQARETDDPGVWEVTVKYSTDSGRQDQAAENPLDRQSVIEYSFERYQEALEFDKNGTAILNSAGDPFDPPIEVPQTYIVITITRNEFEFFSDTAARYQDAINSDIWLNGYEPLTCKVESITGTKKEQADLVYWEVKYTIKYKADTWVLKVLDTGYRAIPDGGTTPQPVLAPGGQPVSNPVLLDGSGKKVPMPGGQAHFLEFHIYDELPFHVLDLP